MKNYTLFLMVTIMLGGQVYASTNEHPIASNRMLQYTYNEADLFYDEDIRRNAPEPRAQQEFEQVYVNAKNGDADSNYLLYKLYLYESNHNAYYEKNPLPNSVSMTNTERALHFLNKALDLNPQHRLALEAMGVNYEVGIMQEKNLNRAIYFYDRAAKSGNIVSANKLFEIYIGGYETIPKDTKKARHYSEIASKFGSEIHKHINNHWDETLKYYESR